MISSFQVKLTEEQGYESRYYDSTKQRLPLRSFKTGDFQISESCKLEKEPSYGQKVFLLPRALRVPLRGAPLSHDDPISLLGTQSTPQLPRYLSASLGAFLQPPSISGCHQWMTPSHQIPNPGSEPCLMHSSSRSMPYLGPQVLILPAGVRGPNAPPKAETHCNREGDLPRG